MAGPIIRLDHVSRTYRVGDVDVHALSDVSVTIEAGEFVARGLQRRCAARADRHGRTRLREGQRDAAADPLAAAGDGDVPAAEVERRNRGGV